MANMIQVGDYLYSTEFNAGGCCEVLKVDGDMITVKLEDYDGKIVTLDAKVLKRSADEDYDNWREGLEEQRELYPDRPIEL